MLMPDPLTQPIINSFHSRTPLRVGSLIVTIFGDAVLPHGSFVPLSNLLDITSEIGIDDGAVRVAVHRLEKDGWLQKQKVGRNVHYALSAAAKAQSKAAAQQIYAYDQPKFVEKLQLLILADGPGRGDAREKLLKTGCGVVSPNIVLATDRVERPASLDKLIADCTQYRVPIDLKHPETKNLCSRAWLLDGLNHDYQKFSDLYQPLATVLENNPLSMRKILTLRILLVHDYRRLILKDPFLPNTCLPKNWQGVAARNIMSLVYDNLRSRSKRWMAG